MKKLISVLVVFLMLTGMTYAEEWSFGSGQKTAADNIVIGPGLFYGIAIATDGTNAVTLNVYDSSTPITAGTNLLPETVVTTSSIDRIQMIKPAVPVRFYKGLSVSPSCAGTYKYVIYYR